MALYCTHYVEYKESAKYLGNKKRDGVYSHCGDSDEECGQEIEGMYDNYCLKHMNMYKCEECNHTPDNHDNISTQKREHCHEIGCKCNSYIGEV
jgi:hypothetical protein